MRSAIAVALAFVCLAATVAPGLHTESFDADPHWDAYENHQELKSYPTVAQDFGYSKTSHAASTPGEVGGQVWRSTTPAWYALPLEKPLTFKDAIHISGTFAVPKARSGGVKLGLFTPSRFQRGGRPPGSLTLEFDGAKTYIRVFVRCIGADNRQAGTLVPHAAKVKDATPIPADGSKHRFTIDYDPKGAGGLGAGRAVVDDLPSAEFSLPAGFADEQIDLTHFGLVNTFKDGTPMEVYFADLKLNGKPLPLQPYWDEAGNHATFEDRDITNLQSFGFCDTANAGGKAGEIGGTIWNSPRGFSFYGAPTGALSTDVSLEISGKISLRIGAPDSGVYVAFFDADALKAGKLQNVLGMEVEGPSRIGHYLRAVAIGSDGTRVGLKEGPILQPGTLHHAFAMKFTPGQGIDVTLDGVTSHLDVPITTSARFDHVGLFNSTTGGGQEVIYLDDLRYSSSR